MRLSTFALLALFVTAPVWAVETAIQYQLPTVDCDNQPIPAGSITAMEFYIDAMPIPASDVRCSASSDTRDTPPAGIVAVVPAQPSDGEVRVNLAGGVTYYVRARVQGADGEWSNLSNQREITLPATPLQAPVIIRWDAP